jgi:hypothetical protein
MYSIKKLSMCLLIAGLGIIALSFDIPKGWFVAGDEPENYKMGIDKGSGPNGTNAATIKSIKNRIKGFGTLMQSCEADKYIDKRIRMSGWMKTQDVKKWAGFWIRVDQKYHQYSGSFDNMHDGKTDRSLKGTNDWKKYDLVVDVPFNATNLSYGALLSGTGQIWFDDLSIVIVDKSVPTTGKDDNESVLNKEPVNLGFEN